MKARKPMSYHQKTYGSGYESEKKNAIPAEANRRGYESAKETMIPPEVRQQQLRKYKEAAAWMHY